MVLLLGDLRMWKECYVIWNKTTTSWLTQFSENVAFIHLCFTSLFYNFLFLLMATEKNYKTGVYWNVMVKNKIIPNLWVIFSGHCLAVDRKLNYTSLSVKQCKELKLETPVHHCANSIYITSYYISCSIKQRIVTSQTKYIFVPQLMI